MKRLGLLARMDNSGLGTQTWEFARAMQPDKVLVIDSTLFNENRQYPERYPGAQFARWWPGADMRETFAQFLDGLDCIFVAESPYDYLLYSMARERGVKVALQYNFEFFDWYWYPHYPKPDLLIAPSMWRYEEIDAWCRDNGVKHCYLHVPVNRNVLPQRRIERAHRFLHPVGRPAIHDRNGTDIVMQAALHLPSDLDVEVLITCQNAAACTRLREQAGGDERISVELTDEVHSYWTGYEGADVLVLPRRYGGNCLPVNEALSQGMPVIMTDMSPNYELLPHRWLIPAEKISEFAPRTSVDIYGGRWEELLVKMIEFARLDRVQMRYENYTANQIAMAISWKAMESRYRAALESI